MKLTKYKISDFCYVTDYVANGSFASLKENVKYQYEKDYAILVRTTDGTKKWNGNYVWVNKESFDFLKKSELFPNDLIMANVGEPGKTFIVPDLKQPMTLGPNSILIRPDIKSANTKYLYYYFNSTDGKEAIKSITSATTQSKFNKGSFRELQIPLPPLPIQKRIAEILDAADALRRKDQELLRKYDELAQAIFIELFGDPVRNEKGWEVKSVIDYCDCIVPGRDKPKSFTGTIPWVTTDDLKHLGITTGSKKSIGLSQFEIKEVKAKVIPPQSVIMTCVGDLGVVSVNNSEIVINQQLHAFQCGEKMNPFFLMYNLSCQEDYMYKMASSTTVPYMNKTVCNSIPVICPPIELQEIFAKRIENIWLQEGLFERNHSDQLFDSLLQQAFKGELVK